METVETIFESRPAQSGHLLRILGVTFGLAVGIGGTIGVGILFFDYASEELASQDEHDLCKEERL